MPVILDDESPFLELMPFAGYKHATPSGSLIIGIGSGQYGSSLRIFEPSNTGSEGSRQQFAPPSTHYYRPVITAHPLRYSHTPWSSIGFNYPIRGVSRLIYACM
jgi:hypothetical protein